MRPKPIYVVDVIEKTVDATNTAVIDELKNFDPMIEQINYQYGSYDEICSTLDQMSKQSDKQYKRYPLFAVIMSFPEDKGRQVGVDGVEDLNIIIARRSNPTDKTPARYCNNFKPVLYPVYLEWLNQIYLSGKFIVETPENIPHQKIDWPYYDTEKGENRFNDYVDAIQIKIKLKLLLKNCY
jgi:hypothetical protein